MIIIPDCPLGYLPFDVLLTRQEEPQNKSVNYAQLPYLLRDYRVRYEYSATLLKAQKGEGSSEAGVSYAGFAPVYEEELLAKSTTNRNIQGNFGNLVYNQEEVSFARNLLGGISFEGETATEQAFKEHARQSNLIHLAMHAFTDDQNPEYSGMIFTAQHSEEDDFLYAYELYNMRLHAQLAVLSACETGTGTLPGRRDSQSGTGFQICGLSECSHEPVEGK